MYTVKVRVLNTLQIFVYCRINHVKKNKIYTINMQCGIYILIYIHAFINLIYIEISIF